MLRAAKIAPPAGADTAPGTATRAAAAQALEDAARGAREGDPLALRTLLRAIEPTVRRICRGVMGNGSPDAEDAIQESLIDVARGLPLFRFECGVSHYVTRIAMRRALASRRRALARWRGHATVDVESLPFAGTDRVLEARAVLLRRMLDELNEAQATTLLLRVMMGHSIEEIAEITNAPVNTVKTRLKLGKSQLRRWLEQSGEVRRARG
jgi:RNA polymerase sigma-70 factor (ECF subfamily)